MVDKFRWGWWLIEKCIFFKCIFFLIFQALAGTMAAMIGSGMVVRSLPYKEGFGSKQIAWMVHSGVVGAVIAPLTMLGGPLMLRAAFYTAGVVGGESEHIVYKSLVFPRRDSDGSVA